MGVPIFTLFICLLILMCSIMFIGHKRIKEQYQKEEDIYIIRKRQLLAAEERLFKKAIEKNRKLTKKEIINRMYRK